MADPASPPRRGIAADVARAADQERQGPPAAPKKVDGRTVRGAVVRLEGFFERGTRVLAVKAAPNPNGRGYVVIAPLSDPGLYWKAVLSRPMTASEAEALAAAIRARLPPLPR